MNDVMVGGIAARLTVFELFQKSVSLYLIALLYFYPYGVEVGDGVHVRAPDLFAIITLFLGIVATLVRGKIRMHALLLSTLGAFVTMEIVAPIVGAVGYGHLVDAVSGARMVMLWLPVIFLSFLALPGGLARFEENLVRIFGAALWLNFGYTLVQLGVAVGAIPDDLLLSNWLGRWSVDEHYNVLQGLRPAGFFVNTTALGSFGVVSLCFFYARYLGSNSNRDLTYVMLSLTVVAVTTSRSALAAALAILIAGLPILSLRRGVLLMALIAAQVTILLLVVERTVGVDEALFRFERLVASGLLQDESFGARVYEIWPRAIDAAKDYQFGTLVQTSRALPIVDSGYLTYYLQGGWVFVGALMALLIGYWVAGFKSMLGPRSQRSGIMVLFSGIYLSTAMIVTNPLRLPIVIVFVTFALWWVCEHRRGLSLSVTAHDKDG